MGSRLLLFALCAACARSTLKDSVSTEHGGADATSELDFWDGLQTVRAVSNRDAVHALFLTFVGNSDGNSGDYAGRVAEAIERGWVREADELPADVTARAGFVAVAVCVEAPIKGGLTMRLGGRGRWAVNELNYLGWLDDMSANQVISGLQLIALMSTVEDYRQGEPDVEGGYLR